MRFMLRYEVNAPDVLVIFVAFKEDRVQIVVNIFLEFLIILFLDTSEMKMDILQMKYGCWKIPSIPSSHRKDSQVSSGKTAPRPKKQQK